MSSSEPPGRKQLAKASERLSFIYVERCTVHRDANAITATDDQGVIHIPAAMVGAFLFGPGTRVTHAAMALLGSCGASVIWTGEGGVRCYAAGRPMASSTRLLEAQARAFSNQQKRLEIARRMYELRFPGEDVAGLTMQQLRGREGARIRRVYAQESQRTGVTWSRRNYVQGNFEDGDPINRTLSSANACLYGVIAAVVHALGMSTGLGFIHTGHDLSFVYDVADLFKAKTSIPASFDTVAQGSPDPENDVRRFLRDSLVANGVMDQCVTVLRELFLPADTSAQEPDIEYDEALSIWSGRGNRSYAAGTNFAEDFDEFEILHGPGAS